MNVPSITIKNNKMTNLRLFSNFKDKIIKKIYPLNTNIKYMNKKNTDNPKIDEKLFMKSTLSSISTLTKTSNRNLARKPSDIKKNDNPKYKYLFSFVKLKTL